MMAKITPELAAMMNQGARRIINPSQPQQPPREPFRERMIKERDRAKIAFDKASYALEVYDNNEDVRKFIDFLEDTQ